MKFMRQLILVAILCAGTVAAWIAFVPSANAVLDRAGVLGALGIAPAAQAQPGQAPGGPGRPASATRVIIEPVQMTALADRVTALGEGQARRSVDVTSEAAGRIIDIAVASGDYVAAGSAFARLDDEAERIARDRANILRENAARELDRLSQLAGTGAVTAVRLQEAQLALRTAELEVEQAEYNLRQRVIRAPIDGWIGVIDIEIGQRIGVQDALARITDRASILIDFRVPERLVGRIAVGQQIAVSPLALRGTDLTGRVRAIDNVVDRASRTLRVQAEVDNPDDTLRGGMAFGIAMEFAGEVLPSVDPLAVQWSRDGSFVWVVRDGKAARVPVTIRQRNANDVLVDADLADGDSVITEGLQDLRPGAEVTVIPPAEEARAGMRTSGG